MAPAPEDERSKFPFPPPPLLPKTEAVMAGELGKGADQEYLPVVLYIGVIRKDV